VLENDSKKSKFNRLVRKGGTFTFQPLDMIPASINRPHYFHEESRSNFLVATCILIYIEFTHQQMHFY